MSEKEDKAIKALGVMLARSTGRQDWSFPEELAASPPWCSPAAGSQQPVQLKLRGGRCRQPTEKLRVVAIKDIGQLQFYCVGLKLGQLFKFLNVDSEA